jgi:hypothetical protein
MKKLQSLFFILISLIVTHVSAQDTYKHPHLNSSGHVLDSTGTQLGWIKDGEIFNAKGEKMGKIEKKVLFDQKGRKLGKIGKNGTFYDSNGAVMFTIEPNSKGEKCKIFDPQGKVIATVHESYKNQACAFHCLKVNMPPH